MLAELRAPGNGERKDAAGALTLGVWLDAIERENSGEQV